MSKMKLTGILALIVISLSVFSCASQTPAVQPTPERAPAAVVAVPSVVAPVGSIDYFGANFVPGEKITVTFVYIGDPGKSEPIENVVHTAARNLEVNNLGSFEISKGLAPDREGIYPVRVYDSKGNIIASSLFRVKKPPATTTK